MYILFNTIHLSDTKHIEPIIVSNITTTIYLAELNNQQRTITLRKGYKILKQACTKYTIRAIILFQKIRIPYCIVGIYYKNHDINGHDAAFIVQSLIPPKVQFKLSNDVRQYTNEKTRN